VTEDDDWFERALREDEDGGKDESEGEDGIEGEGDAEFGGDPEDGADSESDQAEPANSNAEDAEFGSVENAGFGSNEEDTGDAGFGSDATDAGFGDDADAGTDADFGMGDGDGEDDELFDEDFTSAFQSAPGGGGAPESGGGGGDFGGGGGGFGSGGGGGFGDTGDNDSFGMDSGGGFGGGFGGDDEPFESEEFDDEEFESSIPRIDVGIEGLDSMIQGGVPERSLMTTVGSAGTGKTTFGLQFLHEALEQGENAVFITLEESHDRIISTATEKGWDFDEYEEEGSLAVIDLDPIEMANSLTSIRNDLPRLVEEFGATRLVLDSVSLLEMMYDDQATRRNEIYDFTKSLKEAGVTTMLTSEASEDSAYASRHGIIEYLVDAVFILRYIRSSDDFRETRLAVEIQKIRDANHSREIKPYSITNEGISVYRQANIF
jgi:KaiC domain protein